MFSTKKLLALLSSATPEQLKAIRMLPVLLVIADLLQQAQAVCFESKEGNDYTLHCGKNESGILEALKQNCGIYQDQFDDCAVWFTETVDFCKGILDDPVCTLTFHTIIEEPDDCIVNTIQNSCKDGSVTNLDIGVIVTLSAVFLATIAMIAACCAKKKCNNPERAKLLSDDGAPAKDKGRDNDFTPKGEEGSSRMDQIIEDQEPEQKQEQKQPRRNSM